MSQVPTVTPELLARYKARSAVPQDQSSGNAGQLDPGMLMRYKQRAAASLPAQTAFHEDQDATPALPTMPPRNDRAALVNAGQNMVGLPSVSGAMDSPVDPSMAPAMMPMTGAQPPERGFWNEAAQSFAQAAPRGLPDLIRPIAPDTAAALEQRQAVQVGRPNDPSFLNTTVPQTLGGMAGGLVNPQEAPANVVGGMMGGGAARLAGPLVERVAGIAGPRVAAALQHAIGGSAGMAPLAALQRAGQITPEQWATDPGGAISEILKAGAAAGATGGVIGAASGAMAGRPGSGAQETRLAPNSEQLAPVFAPTLDRVPTDLRPTTAAEMPLVLPIEQIPQVPAEVPAALADPATKPPANAGIPEVSSPSPQNATPKVASATPNVSESRGHTLTDSGPQSEPAPDLTRLQSVIDNPAQAKRPELQSVLEMMGLETTGNTAMLRKRIRAAVEASKSAQESPNAVESSNQGGQGQVQGQEGPAPVENVVGSGKLPARGVQEKGQVLSDGRGPFTKADLESRIRSAYESSPERQALSMESDIASQQGGFDDGSGMFSFPGKLPPEIRDATERNPSLRAVFTVGKKGGKGADYLSELGQDKYMRAAMERLGTGIEAAKEVLRTSQDPEHQFLAAVHDNLPEGRAVPKVSLKPDELPKGSRFTINGEPMRVVEGEQGYTVLKDGGSYPETPVDALTEIPADRGSLKTGTNRGHKADISGARGATVESAGLPREPWQMTRKEFEKGGFYQHSVLRDDAPDIGPDGFRSGIGPNVVLATTGTPTDIMQMRYGTKAGRPVYAVPKSETIDTPNGRKIKDGFKPGSKIIPSRDHQPLHEAVVEQAIREGKPVPPEVLADYPDLKPKAKNETSGVFGQSVTDANTGAQRGFVFETESQPQADPRAREGVDAKIAAKFNEKATPTFETVRAGSPEPHDFTQRRAIDTPGPDEPQGPVTSARNAMMEEDRKALGLDALDGPERRSWQAALDTAVSRGEPERALRTATEVIAKPRSLDDIQTAGLVHKANSLKAEHRALMAEIDKLKEPADIQLKAAEAARVADEFNTISTALRQSGTETGRSLASRKLTIDQDYSLVAIKSRAKAAKGAELTPAENARYETLSKQLEELTAKHAELEKKVAESQAERAIKQSGRRRIDPKAREAEFTDLLAKAKDLLAKGCA